jgi:AcrR family transcriptional regulator
MNYARFLDISPKIGIVMKITAKQEAGPEKGRKAAYFARNRAALILATQDLLGDKGWNATIEEVAANAQVSVSTIYQHFDTKDDLFRSCFIEAWTAFETWALESSASIEDPLEQLVSPMRLMFRGATIHPTLAKMLVRNQAEITLLIPIFTKNLENAMRALVKAKVLDVDHADVRITNLKAVLMQTFVTQLENPKSNPNDSDFALSLALPMIGISDAKAKAITTGPLATDTTKRIA